MDFSSGSLAGRLRRCRKFVKQECRLLRALGRCAGDPRSRTPEGFPKSVPGNASSISPCSVPSARRNSPKCSAEEEAGLLPGSAVCWSSRGQLGPELSMGSVPLARHSQVNSVEAEPVPYYLLFSFIALGKSYGSSSSCYGIDSSTVYTGLEPKAASQQLVSHWVDMSI